MKEFVFVNQKKILLRNGIGYTFDYLPDAGWIRVKHVGIAGIYFTFKDDAGEELEGVFFDTSRLPREYPRTAQAQQVRS